MRGRARLDLQISRAKSTTPRILLLSSEYYPFLGLWGQRSISRSAGARGDAHRHHKSHDSINSRQNLTPSIHQVAPRRIQALVTPGSTIQDIKAIIVRIQGTRSADQRLYTQKGRATYFLAPWIPPARHLTWNFMWFHLIPDWNLSLILSIWEVRRIMMTWWNS